MLQGPMVRLVSVRNSFHARVIVARLGADGILAELRGNVDGPYPVGEVHVFVSADDLDSARELLLADEVEDALAGDDEDPAESRAPRALWVLLAAMLLLVALALAYKI